MGGVDVEISAGITERQARGEVDVDGADFQAWELTRPRRPMSTISVLRWVTLLTFTVCCLTSGAIQLSAQTYQPSESNLQARQWFQNAKFGMFIHWGVYSVPSDGEWYMEQKKVPVSEYEKFAPQFN